jgi:hypothetical protein
MVDDLNDENWLLYAAKAYQKLNAVQSEFEGDLMRIQFIKRLITKYMDTGDLKDRLILNHIIIFYNVFGVEPATRLLFLKMTEKEMIVLKPFLIFLSYLPQIVNGVKGQNLNTDDIPLDKVAVKCLRELK